MLHCNAHMSETLIMHVFSTVHIPFPGIGISLAPVLLKGLLGPTPFFQLDPIRIGYLTIILRNRAEYHLILSRRGRRPSWLNQGITRKVEQDNCFIIQQIPIAYHFKNEKNYGSMIKTLKASNT